MQTDKTKHSIEPGIRMIPIDKIEIDPNQPRKRYDEAGIVELKDSIVGKNGEEGLGILQPLTLRERGDKFLITFGERRYRAAKLGGLKEVPAIIRNVTDTEALLMQILENLQREDLHPMDEAAGFKRLAEEKNMSITEISNRTGKYVYFVRQNIKLNDLTAKWQAIFLKDGISVTMALKIATLPSNIQEEIYNNEVTKEDEKADRPIININDYKLNSLHGDLSLACFDLDDTQLDKSKGACSACPFNSSLQSLFPGEQQHPKCNNIACFKKKTTLHIHKELLIAKEDTSIILVYDHYSIPEIVVKLKEEGHQVLRVGYGDECHHVQEPAKPVWEKFIKDNNRSKLSEKKLKEDFKKEEDTYNFQFEVFSKRLKEGKYRKAFMVDSRNWLECGKYLYVEITPKVQKPSASEAQKTIKQGNASLEVIDTEMTRIKNNEVRAKELDQEKIYKKIAETVKQDKTLAKVPAKITPLENVLVIHLLLEQLGYAEIEEVRKVLKSTTLWHPKNKTEYWKALQSLTKNQIAFIARKVTAKKYSSNLPNTKGGYMFRLLAESIGTIPIGDIEKEQNDIAQKRQARVARSLGELNEVRKETVQTEKKTTKKTPLKKMSPAKATPVTRKKVRA